MESKYKLRSADTVNQAIAQLPVATNWDIDAVHRIDYGLEERKSVPWKQAIMVNGLPVAVMSKRYKIVQHEEAFRPIIEGLTLRGIDNFQYSMWNTESIANLAVYLGEGEDGVKLGFRCINSFDGTYAINFGFSAYRRLQEARIVEKTHVVAWGWRQVCENGMKIRVPLKTTKYLDVETVEQVKTLMSEHAKIYHIGDVASKLKTVQYIVEAFALLKAPLNLMIIDARKYNITTDIARELIKKYVGKRHQDEYLEKFGMEEQTLWGLYNTLTFVASHEDITNSRRESLLDKAAVMLEKELITE